MAVLIGFAALSGAPPAVLSAQGNEQPATELRVTLARLLGEHASLLMEVMRARAMQAAEARAAGDELERNSRELDALIGQVYGEEGAASFAVLWRDHITLAQEYAIAIRSGDQPGAEAALDGLDEYGTRFAAFLESATPGLDAHAEAGAVELHIQQLDAFAAADYAESYAAQRNAYRHMFDLGDGLARAVTARYPERFPDSKVAFSPASELRLTLDRLLGEHVLLAAQTMRSALASSSELPAAADALDSNGHELSQALGRVYGAEAGSRFGDLWQEHLDAYVSYVRAASEGEADDRRAAEAILLGYGDRLGTFLAEANPHVDGEALSEMITHHTGALMRQTDAAAAGDHATSYRIVSDAYARMFETGDVVSAAVARQFPDRFDTLEALPPTDPAAQPPAIASTPAPVQPILAATALAVAALLLRTQRERGGRSKG